MKRFRIVLLSLIVWGFCIVGSAQQVYFGDLHSHTSYSDGIGKPSQAYRDAHQKAGMDFLAITDHNHKYAEMGAKGARKDGKLIGKDHSLYSDKTISAALAATEDGEFVALYGQEYSTIKGGNHINVFDVPDVITVSNKCFGELLSEWLPSHLDTQGQPALIQLNHPRDYGGEDEYRGKDCPDDAEWFRMMDAQAQLIEVICGPAMGKEPGVRPSKTCEADYLQYLNMGFHLAPTSGQDTHWGLWGSLTDARTAVVADELTKDGILTALKNRHVYATEDKDLAVIARIDGHLMGDRVSPPPAAGTRIPIEVTINDPEETIAEYEVEIFADSPGGEKAQSIDLRSVSGNEHATDPLVIDDLVYNGGDVYYFLKITQYLDDAPDDHVWTAPVWFETSGTDTALAGGDAACVASKRSGVYHLDLTCPFAQQIAPENRVFGEEARQGRRLCSKCAQR